MLVAQPDQLDAIAAAPTLHRNVVDHKKRRLKSVYYDTPDHALRTDAYGAIACRDGVADDF
ncbi:hypothetical protein [Mesorhizobium sp. INR15]|uniref:hypothetical protein n=1 Tax=Mesorhizobium sp. INR15 TaxID=2654248 RepID=UPI0021563D06|nr:hypothetical protein [Mesorhizobium sp. INR15]